MSTGSRYFVHRIVAESLNNLKNPIEEALCWSGQGVYRFGQGRGLSDRERQEGEIGPLVEGIRCGRAETVSKGDEIFKFQTDVVGADGEYAVERLSAGCMGESEGQSMTRGPESGAVMALPGGADPPLFEL